MTEKQKKIIRWVTYAAVLALFILMATACKQIEYVTVEKVKTVAVHDTTRVVLCEYDSIMVQDSVAWERYKDSVDKYYELHREVRFKFVHDTVDHVREVHDTTKVEVPVEVPVETPLSWKEKIYLAIGRWCWWIILLVILYVIFKICKTFVKQRL